MVSSVSSLQSNFFVVDGESNAIRHLLEWWVKRNLIGRNQLVKKNQSRALYRFARGFLNAKGY